MKPKERKPFDPQKNIDKVEKLNLKAYFECSKGNGEKGLKCKFKADQKLDLLKTYNRLNEGKFENNSWTFKIKYFLRNVRLYRKGLIKKPKKFL